MGKFFKRAEDTKSIVKKKVSINKINPLSSFIPPPPRIKVIKPTVKKSKQVIKLPTPPKGSLASHGINLISNQRLDFTKNKSTYTIGKLKKKNFLGEKQYGFSYTKKF